jgi:hypothetical protein
VVDKKTVSVRKVLPVIADLDSVKDALAILETPNDTVQDIGTDVEMGRASRDMERHDRRDRNDK